MTNGIRSARLHFAKDETKWKGKKINLWARCFVCELVNKRTKYCNCRKCLMFTFGSLLEKRWEKKNQSTNKITVLKLIKWLRMNMYLKIYDRFIIHVVCIWCTFEWNKSGMNHRSKRKMKKSKKRKGRAHVSAGERAENLNEQWKLAIKRLL